MKFAQVHTGGNDTIPVQMAESGGTILLECRHPTEFLHHIASDRDISPLPPDIYLQGVILPDDGAIFQLCDQFGVLAHEVVRLTDAEARKLLLDMVWER